MLISITKLHWAVQWSPWKSQLVVNDSLLFFSLSLAHQVMWITVGLDCSGIWISSKNHITKGNVPPSHHRVNYFPFLNCLCCSQRRPTLVLVSSNRHKTNTDLCAVDRTEKVLSKSRLRLSTHPGIDSRRQKYKFGRQKELGFRKKLVKRDFSRLTKKKYKK